VIGRLRTIFQAGVVLAVLVTGVRFAMGWSLTSVETYCPFGGLETAYALLARKRFTCAAGELNVALMIALLGLALVARKAFCGWACPLGAVFEWTGRLSRRVFRRPTWQGLWVIPAKVDAALKVVLRCAVLVAVLAATWATGELLFRGYDPYYILFSAHGHDVKLWSYAILGVLLGLGLLIPLAWCKYLCPLGASLWPLSAAGRLRLVRSESDCTSCGACDRACPQALAVSTVSQVRSGECTLCFECTEACPSAGALELRLGGRPS
jgi:polyferredoxin